MVLDMERRAKSEKCTLSPNTLNLYPDPECCPNLDPDPHPGLF